MFKQVSLIGLAYLGSVKAGMEIGTCANPTEQATFDKVRYTGRWYELTRDWSMPYVVGLSCLTGDYKVRTDGDVAVTFRGYYYPFEDIDIAGAGRERYGTTASAAITMGDLNQLNGEKKFKILATDYDNYAI